MKNYYNYLNESANDYKLKDLIDAAYGSVIDDELNDAVLSIQDAINQNIGDNAGIFFSNIDDEEWYNMPLKDRIKTMLSYVANETNGNYYEDFDNYDSYDDFYYDINGNTELLNQANANVICQILKIFQSNQNTDISDIGMRTLKKYYDDQQVIFSEYEKKYKTGYKLYLQKRRKFDRQKGFNL